MKSKKEGIITIDDIYPEHEKIRSEMKRFFELLKEADEIQKYLNKFGFNIDVQIKEKYLNKSNFQISLYISNINKFPLTGKIFKKDEEYDLIIAAMKTTVRNSKAFLSALERDR